MGVNPEKDALRKARTRQKIIETGFRVFAERTIDAVNLTDIARAAGLCITTVYSYFSSKEALVMEISVWAWRQYINENVRTTDRSDRTAAVAFDGYLESFIDLYRNHKDILRFNQFFNAYVQRESVGSETMRPFLNMVDVLARRFHTIYERAQRDGSLRTDVSEAEMFSRTLHLMLAIVTRYAVGLVYDNGGDPEAELQFAKDLLMQAYLSK